MSYPINYPTPQGANIQIFTDGGTTSDWVKPQGASFVWFTLIGGGGSGSGVQGGGSGAVTNCMVPAFLIPDVLQVNVSSGESVDTTVVYQQKDGTGYTLLTANASTGVLGGVASSDNYFYCMGFFQSVDGDHGPGAVVKESATTFLSTGGAAASNQTSNYGYTSGPSGVDRDGFFSMSPIIVSGGGMGTGKGGIGSGSGENNVSVGSEGLAVVITW